MENKMQLSKRTQAILKNFASINQSIVINPGNVIQTISNTTDIMAKAQIDETFDKKVSIYDLNEFLAVITVFDEPDITFGDDSVTITQGRMRQVYRYADPSIIKQAPEKGITLPSVEVTAKLSREQLQTIIKAAALNSSTSLTFTNGKAKVWDHQTPNSNVFEIDEISTHEVDYSLSIGVEKLKMVADDYEISICAKG
jgi:hypothetical protein